jgi:septal ring factor EnvC (AmiA/AmiB activator)
MSVYFVLFILVFTVTFQDARRELKGLHDQLNDAQARHLRLQGQAGPLVKTLDNVRRKVENYEAQKNQLQVCRNVLNATWLVSHITQ